MDIRLSKTIGNVLSWKDLQQLETNIRDKGNLTSDVVEAIKAKSTLLGVEYIIRETGVILGELTPAERAIVFAIGEYAAVLKRQGKTPNRTLPQIRSRGLIDAAEVSVSKNKPTQGYQVLEDADLEDLSYESIILNYPEEFSPRATWYARRTLGLENVSEKPPASTHSDVSTRTSRLVTWLKERTVQAGGKIPPFSNADAATAIGLGSLQKYGRVQGNIQSRIDFACYLCDLPPLGCAAVAPFDKAWSQEGRAWAFPILELQQAAQGRKWSPDDFYRIQSAVEKLPGIAHLPWRDALTSHEHRVRSWVTRWAKSIGQQPADERYLQRLSAETLLRATPEFVWAAVQRFLNGYTSERFGTSTDFDLIADGRRFPPKAIFGLALALALDQDIEPKHFSGGEDSTCFRLLRQADYLVVPKEQPVEAGGFHPMNDQDEWQEGGGKLVPHWRRERAAGLAKAKKAQYRRVHGKLTCERCEMDPVEHYKTADAESCIEVHHAKVLVSEMEPGHVTTLDDLQCLCANCHRLVHRRMASIE